MKTLCGSLLICVAAMPAARAQHNKSGLAGVVRDSTGVVIPQANVFVAGGKAAAVSDDSGRFDVRGLPGGPNEVTIAKIGFSPVSFTATLPEDSVVVVAIMLHRVQVLDAVSVTAAAARQRLARTGFYERQRAGFGQFLTPEHVDSVADRLRNPSELLRDLRGVDVHGCRCVVQHAARRDRRDSIPANGEIAVEPRCAGAVDDAAVFDDHVIRGSGR
jgi:hypothetical protein